MPRDRTPIPRWIWGLAVAGALSLGGLLLVVAVVILVAANGGDTTAADYEPLPRSERAATATARERSRPTATSERPSTHSVVYRVTTTGGMHPISLTYTNASGNTEQLETNTSRVGVWEQRLQMQPGEFVYLSVQNRAERGGVECEVYVNGKRVEQAKSDGAYVIASCSGSLPRN